MAAELPVLWRLTLEAFERLAEAAPRIVEVAGGEDVLALPDLGWSRVVAEDAANIPSVVEGALRNGPVLLGPQWQRIAPEENVKIRLPGQALRSEALLAEFRPAARESVLGVVLPTSTLTSRSRQPLREIMEAHWRPAVVLYAAEALYGVHYAFEIAVLLLIPRERQWSTVIFQVPADTDAELVIGDFRALLQLRKGVQRGRYGYVVKSSLAPGDSLNFDRHDPAVLERQADLGGYGAATTLAELCELVALGVRLSRTAERNRPSEEANVRVLRGRDIRRDGGILPPDENSQWAKVPPEHLLKPGDIVLPTIFSASGYQGLVAAEVTQADLPAVAGDTVMLLRPRAELSREQRQFTLLYLQSPLARTLALSSSPSLRNTGRVLPSGIASLVVPVPDAALMTAIGHIQDAEKRFGQWRDEAGALLRSMFLSKGAEAQRAHIIESGLKVRSRADAAALVDDPGYFVRTRFPYPLALRWRRAEAARALEDWELAYREIREAGEVFTCYMALVTLALARSSEPPITIGAANQIRHTFDKGVGPGWGQWKAVLKAVGEIRKLPPAHPLRRMKELEADEEANAALQRLYNRRNDESHLRAVDYDDLPPQVTQAFADLATLARSAEFLAEWTLADVVGTSWDSFKKTATVTYRPMMGDHPIVSTRTDSYPTHDIEQGSLYIIDDDDQWHLLRPFLVGKRCTVCKTWSTFHADMASDSGETRLLLKSLEDGHVQSGQSLSQPLEQVGLLPLDFGTTTDYGQTRRLAIALRQACQGPAPPP